MKCVYAIAMSQRDGCLVMLCDGKVVGACTRVQSELLAQGVIEWREDTAEAKVQAQPEPPRLVLIK